MKCPKCGATMETRTYDSETGAQLGKVGGMVGAAALGFMVGGPLGAGVGAFLAKKAGGAAGAKVGGKLFEHSYFACPKCGHVE